MLNFLSDPYYDMDIFVHVISPIKVSEMVDLSVFYSPLYIFLIQDSVREGKKGKEDLGGSSVEGGSKEEEKSLFVRVTIEMQCTLLMSTGPYNASFQYLHSSLLT